MAGMMTESYMLQALVNGIQSVQQNPALLADILDALNEAELQAAQSYFGNPETQIYLSPGFPMEAAQMPFIGVTIANESQITEQTPIGLVYERVNNGDGTWTDIKGARFNGTLKATIYSPNADLVIWLSAICSWSLLSQYNYFNEYGIGNIQTGLGDFEPSPQWLPMFTFARGILLSAEYDKTFTVSPTIVTSQLATGNFSVYTEQP